MSDVDGRNAAGAEKLLFKGEDAEEAVDDAAHGFRAALTPSPDLWGDEVDDGYAEGAELGGDAEVKVGGVGEDGKVGTAGCRDLNEPAELFVYAWDVVDYFN